MEKKEHSFCASFLGILSGTGCMHSKRRDGSKFAHCLQECSSKPHLGHWRSEKPRVSPAFAPGGARRCPYGQVDRQALSAFQFRYPGIRVGGICGRTRIFLTPANATLSRVLSPSTRAAAEVLMWEGRVLVCWRNCISP